MNITKKKQIHRYREQTRAYQWGEGWLGQIGVERKQVIMELNQIMCMKLLKIVKYYRILRIIFKKMPPSR